jgi:hypothetical protein
MFWCEYESIMCNIVVTNFDKPHFERIPQNFPFLQKKKIIPKKHFQHQGFFYKICKFQFFDWKFDIFFQNIRIFLNLYYKKGNFCKVPKLSFSRKPKKLSPEETLPRTPNALKNYVKNLLGLNLEKWGSIPFCCSFKTLSKAIWKPF